MSVNIILDLVLVEGFSLACYPDHQRREVLKPSSVLWSQMVTSGSSRQRTKMIVRPGGQLRSRVDISANL